MKTIDFLDVNIHKSPVPQFGNMVNPEQVYIDVAPIRDIATKSSMILCPIEYFDIKNALSDEMMFCDDKKLVTKSINNFIEHFSENGKVYALCPPQFYDLEKHIKTKTEHEIFAGKYENAFFAMKMCIPALRALNERMDNHEKRITNLETTAKQMKEQLEQERRRNIILEDPLLFAIPNGSSIYDNPTAIMGPCWGPDIDISIVESLKLAAFNKVNRLGLHQTWADLVSPIKLLKDEIKSLNNELKNYIPRESFKNLFDILNEAATRGSLSSGDISSIFRSLRIY